MFAPKPSFSSSESSPWHRITTVILFHSLAGAIVGYLVLHPAAMVSQHIFEGDLAEWTGAFRQAFAVSHLPMSAYFVVLGTLGGLLQGLYVDRLKGLNERLELLSRTDSLTGLYNRRQMVHLLDREEKRARRNGSALSVAILDIDHFKLFNDGNGHQAGDELLITFARIIRSSVREVDIVTRYGGEEFVVILPNTPLEHAFPIVERLRSAVRDHRFSGIETQPTGRLTVSVGLAQLDENSLEETTLIEVADVALYRAKNRGRDRTCCG